MNWLLWKYIIPIALGTFFLLPFFFCLGAESGIFAVLVWTTAIALGIFWKGGDDQ